MLGEEEKKNPYTTTADVDQSSKDSTDKAHEAGVYDRDLPQYHYHDTEAAIGEGEIGALETAEDIVTTVIHVDDDPTINPWTFRMFFIGEFLRQVTHWVVLQTKPGGSNVNSMQDSVSLLSVPSCRKFSTSNLKSFTSLSCS